MVDTVADKYFAEYAQDFSYKSNLKLQVFRNILPELLRRKYIASENPFNDYLKAAKISNELESIKAENDSLKAEIALLENPNYRFALNNKINKVSQVFKGNTATDFEMKSLTNEAVKLSHFKGKVILIDVWASWCGPCKKQMPIFQALQDHFKEKEDIVLISLSIDDNSQAWERSVKELKLNGHNYLIDRARLSAYSLSSVPRTIIIDQNFNIYDATAELTSKKLIEELEKLREAKPI
ncbi:TlpA disulfide reductase family protein [Olivibacter sp. XZL3]|uniref:TlpA family protein disulfide reductase n=1 Tax=Olivibacter sp. XZL3 TaxID=1735116 RepID=UPI001065FDC3|nr:TlpA disulfide reductase family protein [Olivibacter sp. XZL3]